MTNYFVTPTGTLQSKLSVKLQLTFWTKSLCHLPNLADLNFRIEIRITKTGPSLPTKASIHARSHFRENLKKGKNFACIYLFSSGFSYIRPMIYAIYIKKVLTLIQLVSLSLKNGYLILYHEKKIYVLLKKRLIGHRGRGQKKMPVSLKIFSWLKSCDSTCLRISLIKYN